MIYSIDQVRHLHLEISSLCNAACPLCPRNFNGYEYNQGYKEHNMTLEEAQKIFSPEFIQQLKGMIINGNFGDAVMNPDTPSIVRYFKEHNPSMIINISTNGGARDAKFWRELAEVGAEVTFCLDGIDDYTHGLYRRNTLYTTVIRNAQTFIAAGGRAIWKMIDFEHNRDQQKRANKISQELGFAIFFLVNDGRDNTPVYDRNGDFQYIIGPSKISWEPPARVEPLLSGHIDSTYEYKQIDSVRTYPIKQINCEVKRDKSLYVSSEGDVFPCCYVGFPDIKNNAAISYGFKQVKETMFNNNALKTDLKTCIEWFNKLEESWDKPSYKSGRNFICNITCGGDLERPRFHVKEAEFISHTS